VVGIKDRLAMAPIPIRAEAFNAALLFRISKLHLPFPWLRCAESET